MVAARTTADLLSEVKDQALLPSTDGRLTDAQILTRGDHVMDTLIAQVQVSARQQRMTRTYADTSIVSGTSLYAIPERALAAGATDIVIVSGTEEYHPPEIDQSDAWRYRSEHGGWDSPYAYCWLGDTIELLPHPEESTYTLRVYYPEQPSRLVTTSSCAVVASKTATVITTSATVPTAWGSSETLDIVSHRPNGKPRGVDLAGTSISGTSVTVSAGVPSTVVAGDFVCLDGTTCVPPIPQTLWPVLVAGTTLEVLRALGDPAASDAERRLAESLVTARDLLSPRSRGQTKKIIAYHSPLRRGWR